MRVLHVQRVNGIAGSERHLLALLPALSARGVQLRMCVVDVAGGSGAFVAALRDEGVDVSVVADLPRSDPRNVIRVAGEIRRFRPDVVHTHLIDADVRGQMAAAMCRVRGVSSMHGVPAFYRREPYRTVGRLVGRRVTRRIAISHHVATFLDELPLGPQERVRVVHYGIHAEEWGSDANQRDAARLSFGVAPGDVVIGTASRLIAGKGLELLLEAFAESAQEVPRLRLLLAGDGPLRPQLEHLAGRCPADRVKFLGFISDMKAFMRAADVLAFTTQPELGEGFGLAALEAMAAGRPVLATNVASLPEIVIHGRSGVLVPPGSVSAIKDALMALGQDDQWRAELGTAAGVRARTVFTLDQMVAQTMAVYDECCA